MNSKNNYAPAYAHDPIEEIFDGVYLLRGSIRIGPGMHMGRNMVILRETGGEGAELTLINPVRMRDEELSRLETLGSVKRVLRLGDFHGLDDAFYLDRYGADFWCQPGQSSYPEPAPSHVIDAATPAPIADAQFFLFETARYPEAALLLQQHRLLITTDAIQYYDDWRFTSRFTRLILPLMGFSQRLLIGKPWIKRVTPKGGSLRDDFERLLSLEFDHLVAAHGSLLRGGAREQLREEMTRCFG